MKNVISMRDFSKEQITAVLDAAEEVKLALHDPDHARKFQRDHNTKVTNLLRLLKLDIRVQELLVSGDLSEAHGKIILGLPNNLQYEVAKKSVEQGWATRRVEQEVKKMQAIDSPCSAASKNSDPDICALEKLISGQIGSEVKLEADSDNKAGGWLKIRYFNNEILTGILDKMGIDYNE